MANPPTCDYVTTLGALAILGIPKVVNIPKVVIHCDVGKLATFSRVCRKWERGRQT